MVPLREFHLFPTLPSELRLKIWEVALQTPRTIEIVAKKDIHPVDRTRISYVKAFLSNTPPPATLSVCRESRFEALQIYKPYFGTATSSIRIWLSFEQDTVKSEDSLLELLGRAETQGIRAMVLDVRDAAYFGHFNMDILKSMKNLRVLDLWVKEGQIYSWSHRGVSAETITGDFEQEKMMDPGWHCPSIRIIERGSEELVCLIPGGALLPGWKEGDRNPFA